MIIIENTLISEEIFTKKFVCDLNACKGACCVEGDSGAPLDADETKILDEIFEDVKPYLTGEGIKAIEEQGKFITDSDGDLVTPLVDGKHCAYTIFENGTAFCGIEKAYLEGKIPFKKPISCHLYPIRITNTPEYILLNYNEWNICKPACACGEKLKVPVYKFLKEPLTRKFGPDWYSWLCEASGHI